MGGWVVEWVGVGVWIDEGREGKEGRKEREREGGEWQREGGRDGGPATLSTFFFHLMDFLGTVD